MAIVWVMENGLNWAIFKLVPSPGSLVIFPDSNSGWYLSQGLGLEYPVVAHLETSFSASTRVFFAIEGWIFPFEI